jgi:hypothetical protein
LANGDKLTPPGKKAQNFNNFDNYEGGKGDYLGVTQ